MESTNHPTPVILDDDALAEIEARANAATAGPWHTAKRRPALIIAADKARIADCHTAIGMDVVEAQINSEFVAQARTDIPALCQTVRALRAEIAEWESHRDGIIEAVKTAEVRVEELEESNTALREQLAETQGAVDHWFRLYTRVSADNVGLLNQLAQVEKEREAAKTLLSRSLHDQIEGVFGRQNHVVEQFRAKVIKTCSDRAAEWGQIGLSNTYFAGKEEAAQELAAELEKLQP